MRERWWAFLCRIGRHRYRPSMRYFMSGGDLYVRERCVRWLHCTAERTRLDSGSWKRGSGV